MVAETARGTASDLDAGPAVAAPFDAVAERYDAWGHTSLGGLLRGEAWRWLDTSFATGDRVLELGCGTGADAIHLARRGVSVLATDASRAMLAVADRNVRAAGADDLVRLAPLDMEQVGRDGWQAQLPETARAFDGAFSDFGAVNCVADRRRLAAGLSTVIPPGGRLVLTVMGPLCAWEVAWHLAHGEPRIAARRFRAGAAARVDGARVRVWYPSPRRLRLDLHPWFEARSVAPVAVALPPTALAGVVERRPRLLRALAAAEGVARRVPGAAWTADHYVAVFERRAA